jgi:hypothetical protein
MIEAKGAMKVYTGIGGRETPGPILALMGRISARMDRLGFTLRSGGADGADSAFEEHSTRKEIFLPYNGFNGRHHDGVSYFDYLLCPGRELAQESVERFHPAPSRLYGKGRKLMARNAMQVLGRDCKSPTDVVICWTKTVRMSVELRRGFASLGFTTFLSLTLATRPQRPISLLSQTIPTRLLYFLRAVSRLSWGGFPVCFPDGKRYSMFIRDKTRNPSLRQNGIHIRRNNRDRPSRVMGMGSRQLSPCPQGV